MLLFGEQLRCDGSSGVQGFLLGFLLHHRPLKNISDISLMDDTQNEWGEDEPSDAKRIRVRKQKHSMPVELLMITIFFLTTRATMA